MLAGRLKQVLFSQGTALLLVAVGGFRAVFLLFELGTTEFGLYATAYNTAAMLGAYGGLNSGEYLARSCPGRSRAYQIVAFWGAVQVSLPAAAVAIASLPVFIFVGNPFGWSTAEFACLIGAGVATMWLLVLQGYLYGLDRIYAARMLNVVTTIGWFLVLLPYAWAGGHVTTETTFAFWCATNMAVLMASIALFRKSLFGDTFFLGASSDTSPPTASSIARFCLALYPRTLAKSLMNLGDRYAFVAFGRLEALSFFSLLKEGVAIATNVGNLLASAMSPPYFTAVNLHGAESRAARHQLTHLVWLSVLLIWPATVGFWSFAYDISALLSSGSLSGMVMWIAPVPVLWNLVTVLERWYLATGHVGRLGRIRLVWTVGYVLAAWVALRLAGAWGVPAVMTAMFAFTLASLLWSRSVRQGIAWRDIPSGAITLILVTSAVVLPVLARTPSWPLSVRLVVAGAFYVGAVGVVGRASSKFRSALKGLPTGDGESAALYAAP